MSYHEGSNWQAKKEDEGKPLYENKSQPKEEKEWNNIGKWHSEMINATYRNKHTKLIYGDFLGIDKSGRVFFFEGVNENIEVRDKDLEYQSPQPQADEKETVSRSVLQLQIATRDKAIGDKQSKIERLQKELSDSNHEYQNLYDAYMIQKKKIEELEENTKAHHKLWIEASQAKEQLQSTLTRIQSADLEKLWEENCTELSTGKFMHRSLFLTALKSLLHE